MTPFPFIVENAGANCTTRGVTAEITMIHAVATERGDSRSRTALAQIAVAATEAQQTSSRINHATAEMNSNHIPSGSGLALHGSDYHNHRGVHLGSLRDGNTSPRAAKAPKMQSNFMSNLLSPKLESSPSQNSDPAVLGGIKSRRQWASPDNADRLRDVYSKILPPGFGAKDVLSPAAAHTTQSPDVKAKLAYTSDAVEDALSAAKRKREEAELQRKLNAERVSHFPPIYRIHFDNTTVQLEAEKRWREANERRRLERQEKEAERRQFEEQMKLEREQKIQQRTFSKCGNQSDKLSRLHRRSSTEARGGRNQIDAASGH